MKKNKAREQALGPGRIKTALRRLKELGYEVSQPDKSSIQFTHLGETVTYFPYTGWATGKSIEDGRGLQNLLMQLKMSPK